MSTKNWQRVFSFVVLAGMLISLARPGSASQAQAAGKPAAAAAAVQENPLAKVEQQVLDEIQSKGQTDFFINLKAQADLAPASKLSTKVAKDTFVFKALQATASRSQKDLLKYLGQHGVKYTAYYIQNTILVKGGSQGLLNEVAARSDVASIKANHTFQLDKPIIQQVGPEAPATVEPNIIFVKAPDVWAMGITGQGIVLASNDTGIQWDHPALINHYRGWNGSVADHNYNWWDATGGSPTVPFDGFGHGTHTSGTMVGDDGGANQIGMAPGAQLVACRNMDAGGGGIDSWFLTCFQWDLAPWDLNGNNPRPDLAPDAINNSWGYGGGGVNTFRAAIDALQAAGILVEVSAGNEGSSCQTLRSPGDYSEVLTTGSVNHAGGVLPGTLTGFSSRGPSSLDGNYFPDVMAPGENIRSSVPGSIYQGGWSGTSMSGPHVTGLIALLWSANPALKGQVDATMQLIKDTAVPLTGQNGSNCGGDYSVGPNNDWGYGTIDSLAAVQMALAFGGVGTLQGTVTDSITGNPIAGAQIVASLSVTQSFQTTTNPSGEYTMAVYSGTYTVDASAYGYYTGETTGVVVVEDGTTTLDIPLVAAPSSTISVNVVDANTGWPLYAVTTVGGTPFDPIWNDPVSGHFDVTVPTGGTYALGVDAWVPGYQHKDVIVGPVSGNMDVTVYLNVDSLACDAPGYTLVTGSGISENFDAGVLPAGWSIVNNGGNCDWAFNDPFSDGNNTGGEGWFADGDSNACGPSTYMDTELRSPVLDFSGQSTVAVQFKYDYWNLGDTADVDVSNDGGTTWTNVWERTSDDRGPATANIDISSVAGNQANVMVRWHYYNAYWAWYWQVDDVTVQSLQCLPPTDGGLVVGNVYDSNEGNPLVGATVADEGGFSTLTEVTVDPNVDDGFYTLFSPSGNQGFTATDTGFGPDNESVAVVNDGTVGQNFYLPAGHLLFDPLNMHVTVQLGDNTTLPLTITNNGDYAATFNIKEIDKGFTPVAQKYNPPAQSPDSSAQLSQSAAANTKGARAPLAPAADVILNQAPNGVNGLFADSDCSLCGTGQQSIAENFQLPAGGTIGQIVFWTGYFPGDIPQDPDQITVIFHSDLGGVPGPVVYSESNVAYDRAQTGVILFGVHEWMHTLTLASAVSLDPGIYWVEIFNNTSGNGDQFFWETGNLDPVYGLPGSGWTTSTPGSSWNYDGATDLAIQLVTGSTDVPWLSESPITGTIPAFGTVLGKIQKLPTGAGTTQNPGLTVSSPTKGVTSQPEAPANPAAVLWDQPLSSVNQNAYVDQDFPDFPAFSSVLADDFTNASPWSISTIYVPGDGWNGFTTLMNATALNWLIYADCSGIPCGDPTGAGAPPVWGTSLAPTDGQVVITNGTLGYPSNTTLNLAAPVELAPGHYWLVFYPNMPLAGGGQFGRQPADTTNGYTGQFINPGGAFGYGTVWTNWTVLGQSQTDIAFRLDGTVVPFPSQVVNVTFDAGVPEVTQPGTYKGALKIGSDTPYPATTIPVTMTVTAPASYGKLEGTVQSLGYCDINPVPLADATVIVQGSSGMTWTLTTDANGYYQLWLDSAETPVTIDVSADQHVAQNRTGVTILPGGAVTTEDFGLRLMTPCVTETPPGLSVTLLMGSVTTTQMTLNNTGAADSAFAIREKDGGYSPSKRAAQPQPASHPVVVPGAKTNAVSTKGILIGSGSTPNNHIQNAGDVLDQWSTGLTAVWGTGFSLDDGTPWFGSLAVIGGDDNDHEFEVDGTPTGRTMYALFDGGVFGGDMTFDKNTGMFWQVNVEGDNCLYELDPNSGATGNTICGPWSVSQRGLAYDPDTDTFYVGSWNDGMIYHIDSSGNLIESWFVGLSTSGLAFNPDAGLLFVQENSASDAISVFDVATGSVIDSFTVAGFGNYVGAGLEIDCDGNLWAGNQGDGNAYLIDSGVPGNLCSSDVPWVSENPITGTLTATTGQQDVTVTFDASTVPQPGKYMATLKVKTDDKFNGTINVPITMTVAPTPDFGMLAGTVTTPGYCDTNPGPLEGATILIEAANGMTYTVTTDATGTYSRWLKVADGPYIVSASLDGYEFQIVPNVVVPSLGTVSVNFSLRLLQPCVKTAPTTLNVDVPLGYNKTVGLDLLNNGAVSADFVLKEVPAPSMLVATGASRPVVTGPAPKVITIGDKLLSHNPQAPTLKIPTKRPTVPQDGITITESDSQDIISGNSVACNNGFAHTDNSYLRVFDLSAFGIDADFNITSVDVGIEQATSGSGSQPVTVNLYTLEGPLMWENMTLIGTADATVDDQSLTIVNVPVEGIAPAGSQLVVEFFTPDGNAGGNLLFVGSNNEGQTGPTYLAAAPCGVTEPTDVVDIGFPGMMLVMNVTGELANQDIPWLAETPITGTIAHDSNLPVDVTFTALPTLTVGTSYTGTLVVKSNDPMYPKVEVPVTMNVVEPVYGVEVSADQTGSGEPGTVVTYTVTVTNTSNFATDSFTITLGTHVYTTTLSSAVVGPLGMGESATFVVSVLIPANAADGDHDTVQVTATSVADNTKTATMSVTTNVFVVAPPMFYIYLPTVLKNAP